MTELISKLPLTKFWAKNKNSIWLTSTLSVHRNLKTHFFPHKLSPHFLADLTVMLKQPLLKSSLLKKGSFFFMKDLKPNDIKLLSEYFIPRKEYSAFRGSEGLIIGPNARFHALINTEDHLILSLVDEKNHLEEAWCQLLILENELSKEIEFAFSHKYGFLTSDLKKCGTGLEIALLLHLPALIHTNNLSEHLDKIHSQTVKSFSFLGEKNIYLANLLLLVNQQKIHISEENLIKTLHSQALSLIIAENKIRDEIKNNPSHSLKNEVSKAFGTLKHAYQLEAQEALLLVSLCKLGVELNWIKNVELETINELFFSLRQGILELKKKKSTKSLPEFRSEHIKNILEKAVI